jgi:endonuclease YncB( thermonuclease family)
MAKKTKLSAKSLLRKGVPAVLIPGFLVASILGWKIGAIDKIQNYYQLKALFPSSGIVSQVEDGDTFTIKNGITVRLLGINAPDKGQKNFDLARNNLTSMVNGKKVFLEYDRYQDDKYGRVLAWVWIDCETTPKFLPADYMHKSGNESMPGLTGNPSGCKKGKLINEELVKEKLASPVVYKDRGELKYEVRLQIP